MPFAVRQGLELERLVSTIKLLFAIIFVRHTLPAYPSIIIELPAFTRYAADYFNDGELAELQLAISSRPDQRGARYAWRAQVGHGPVWVSEAGCECCHVQDTLGRIWLLTVYAKSARENIAVSTSNAGDCRKCRTYLKPNCWRAMRSAT